MVHLSLYCVITMATLVLLQVGGEKLKMGVDRSFYFGDGTYVRALYTLAPLGSTSLYM